MIVLVLVISMMIITTIMTLRNEQHVSGVSTAIYIAINNTTKNIVSIVVINIGIVLEIIIVVIVVMLIGVIRVVVISYLSIAVIVFNTTVGTIEISMTVITTNYQYNYYQLPASGLLHAPAFPIALGALGSGVRPP